MKEKIIQILVQQLFSEEGRKRLLMIVAFIFFLAFLPIIVVASINPFSPFQSKSASNDPYISVKTNIQNSKKVSVDINILRAIDTVFFTDSKDENSIQKRADKYLYTEKKIVKKEQQYLHDYCRI